MCLFVITPYILRFKRLKSGYNTVVVMLSSDAAANWMPLSRGTSRTKVRLYPTIGAPVPWRASGAIPRSISVPTHRRLPALIDHALLANERWQAGLSASLVALGGPRATNIQRDCAQAPAPPSKEVCSWPSRATQPMTTWKRKPSALEEIEDFIAHELGRAACHSGLLKLTPELAGRSRDYSCVAFPLPGRLHADAGEEKAGEAREAAAAAEAATTATVALETSPKGRRGTRASVGNLLPSPMHSWEIAGRGESRYPPAISEAAIPSTRPTGTRTCKPKTRVAAEAKVTKAEVRAEAGAAVEAAMEAAARARARGAPPRFGEGQARAWRLGAFDGIPGTSQAAEAGEAAEAEAVAAAAAAVAKPAELESGLLAAPRDSALRLQVFRGALDLFIGHFDTYAVPLAAIKRAYDGHIDELRAALARAERGDHAEMISLFDSTTSALRSEVRIKEQQLGAARRQLHTLQTEYIGELEEEGLSKKSPAERLRGAVRATSKALRLLSAFEGVAGPGDLGDAVQRLMGQLAEPEKLKSALAAAQALEPSHKAQLVTELLSGMGHGARAAALSTTLGSLSAANLEQAPWTLPWPQAQPPTSIAKCEP